MPGSHGRSVRSGKLESWCPETPVSHRMGVPASPRERALDRPSPWTWNAGAAGESLPRAPRAQPRPWRAHRGPEAQVRVLVTH